MSAAIDRLTSALADRYRIDREIGAGGMATVYLAYDVRHARNVALKVLHPDLTATIGVDRFLAEIRVTANLQHPNILGLFDSGVAEGQAFYVMPYVEGESLRDRLTREQQLPVADALTIARGVAAALEYAHAHGVIHRDIKPENVLLQAGHPVVADFGIALAVQQAGGQRLTQTGMSLGTPQYMSPEQAMGERTLDARTDVYALAVVIYEMFAGEPPFTGPNAQAIAAKVLTEKPRALGTLRETVPPQVEAAVHRALSKLPADRFASAAEFKSALTDAAGAPWITGGMQAGIARTGSRQTMRRAVPWAVATVGIVAAFAYGRQGAGGASGMQGPVFATLSPLEGETWRLHGAMLSVSPDGRRIALKATLEDGQDVLEIRSLDSLSTRALNGTSGASYPFWSPDGAFIGFFADGALKVIELRSGAVRKLCPSADARGGTWGPDGTILYTPEGGAGLHTTPSSGGPCQRLTMRVPEGAERPYFFPDGRHFVLTGDEAVWIGKTGDDSLTLLATLDRAQAVFAAPDFLLQKRSGSSDPLFAQRIDVGRRRLVGEPVKIVDGVPNPGGHTTVSSSANGVLAANVRTTQPSTLIGAIDLGGSAMDTMRIPSGTDGGSAFRLSRDGRRVAFGGWEIAVMDLTRRVSARLAINMDPTVQRMTNPQWSPGDTAIAYATNARVDVVDTRSGRIRALFATPVAGRSVELTDWSRDGRYLAFTLGAGGGAAMSEAWLFDFVSGSPRRLFDEGGNATGVRFAPNGSHIAYWSTVGGGAEVFIRTFPGPGAAVRASTAGGRSPRWRGDGAELFYVAASRDVMAVQVRGSETPVLSAPRLVLRAQSTLASSAPAPGVRNFDVSPDGKRFYFNVSTAERYRGGLTVILDWWKLMERAK